MNPYYAWLSSLFLVVILATPVAAQFPLTVSTSDGGTVMFEKPPERIIAFDSAVVEILFAIGEGDRIVGIHNFVSHPPQANTIPRFGDAYTIDLEGVIETEPDLVAVFHRSFIEDLKRAGLKVFFRETLSENFQRVADNIRLWGQITGSDRAQDTAQEFEKRVTNITNLMESVEKGPRVFQDVGGFWTPGSGTLMQEVFNLLRLKNISDEVLGYKQFSPEMIASKNPQIILTENPSLFTDHPGLKNVYAVQHNRFCLTSSNALDIAGPRFVLGIEELADCIYGQALD